MNENKVTIYYWEAKGSIGRGSAGHVSLRTYTGGQNDQGYYISFWPELDKAGTLTLLPTVSSFSRNLEEDIGKEKESPIDTFDLYILDASKINEQFTLFLESGCKFHLLGSLKFGSETVDENFQCCSGLVYDLLYISGLPRYIPNMASRARVVQELSGAASAGGPALTRGLEQATHFTKGGWKTASRIRNPAALMGFICIIAIWGILCAGTAAVSFLGHAIYATYQYFLQRKMIITPASIASLVREAVTKELSQPTEAAIQLCNQGDARGQYEVAHKCLHGWGVSYNPQLAIELYNKAANQGHAGACYDLARLYSQGNSPMDIEKNISEAERYASLPVDQTERFNTPDHKQSDSIEQLRALQETIRVIQSMESRSTNSMRL